MFAKKNTHYSLSEPKVIFLVTFAENGTPKAYQEAHLVTLNFLTPPTLCVFESSSWEYFQPYLVIQ